MPETVHHVVVPVDPLKDPSWMGLRNHIKTDGVHYNDNIKKESQEKWSEAVKILKGLLWIEPVFLLNLLHDIQLV